MLWALLAFLLAGSAAQAGHWSAVYDLAPGSNLQTTNPGGVFNDPITGSMTIEYDAASSGAPLTGARLVTGQIDNMLNQNAGVILLTGSLMNMLSPGTGGTPGTLSGVALNLAVVANHTVSGFLHCTDAVGGTLGACNAFFGTPSTNPIPQTGTGTFQLPTFNFAATAGVGNFTSTASVQTPQTGVTTSTVYVGQEVSRVWVADVPAMNPAAMGALLTGLLVSGGVLVRRLR